MDNSWRTIFPEYQEEPKTPTRRKEFNHKLHASQIGDIMASKDQRVEAVTPRKINKNELSKDNPLSNSMHVPASRLVKKNTNKNADSLDNPLNYKVKLNQSMKTINTKITASNITGLPASVPVKSPPRFVKTVNSETFLDFLPGSQYPKTPANETSRRKLIIPNLTNETPNKSSCKKLKDNKLHNIFSISSQFEV
jgi:hypothetical protein